ncbi:outer membrane beta-barrel protein [Dyadobacter subterraneus]|uniref:Outer membrane beta-barrel protein n=1 Tax=Dyadobacter subterraneus TaxID=2773304 RepID=A0ABR9WFX7_9BACT|nr:outer membrane beta-barrel family protein [Dyadobacter subterraneus]MBE9464422.1 outer membrane beta-barrel protein [Dyadobacter subterraneus]
MKTIITSLLILFLTKFVVAQTTDKTISGTIKDTRNEVLPGTTVRLLQAIDSTLIKGEITDVNGSFQFNNLENNTYLLAITAVGQKPFTSVPLTIDSVHSMISLPVIILLPAKSVELNEVTVKAKKPLIVQEIDKTTVNVEAMISSATSNTLEILEKTPGVSVSSNGDVSLNGRGGVLVLIDGRSTYMSGADLAAYLKSLPGGMLEKIELMDNPPAKYDAAGNAIINIRLKKNRVGGFTGNVAAGISIGRYVRSNDALNLNYNYKKVNLFANLGYGFEKNYSLDKYDRRFYDTSNELTSTVNLVNKLINTNNFLSANFGLDFTATAKTTLGVIVNLNGGNRNGNFNYTSRNFNAAHELDAIGSGSTESTDKRNNTGINLNLLHKLNTTGREFSADVNYLKYNTSANQILQNSTFLPDGLLNNRNDFLYEIPSDINIYTAKADYVHPLKNKAKMEAGIKTSMVDNDFVFNYFDENGNSQTIDNSKSNHFKYKENVNAAYVNGQKTWKRFGAQLGVRFENTHARGRQLGNEIVEEMTFTKNYSGLFPSIFLNYKLDDKGINTFGIMAVRRINRPNYQLLNPFIFFKDQYSYSSGNPGLTPQYQNRVELKYQHKQFLNMGLSYNEFSDLFFQTTQTVDSIFISRPENIAKGYMVLLNTTVSVSPTKWWYINTTLRLSHITTQGKIYTENLDIALNMARFEMNNYLTLGKNWNAELGGYYASTDITGQAITGGMYRVNASVQKKIMNGKGSIRISAEDVFHSWVYHNRSVSLKQSDFTQITKTDTPRIGFAFTYRFGKDTFARKRKYNNNGTDDEKERVN